jgi:signal transduction histidine kinase
VAPCDCSSHPGRCFLSGIAAVAFLIDLKAPNDIADGFFYIVAPCQTDSLELLGLNDRLDAIGGTLAVSNVKPHGVQVEARVPIL